MLSPLLGKIRTRTLFLSGLDSKPQHLRLPPLFKALMDTEAVDIDGFLLPGHVSVIIGTDAYAGFFEKYRVPCVVTGFEPVDILQAVYELAQMVRCGTPRLTNCYPRAVTASGNVAARRIMYRSFAPCV